MKKNIKKKWLAALKSGKYKQGQEWLVQTEEHGKTYCCLGVLCHLWAREKHKKMPEVNRIGTPLPPEEVLVWAGLDEDTDIVATLARVNDKNPIDHFKKVIKEIKRTV